MNCFKCKYCHEGLTIFTCFGNEFEPEEDVDCDDFEEDR